MIKELTEEKPLNRRKDEFECLISDNQLPHEDQALLTHLEAEDIAEL